MPSITPYLAFDILIDNTGTSPQLTFTDVGTYPSGVPELVKGNFTITQPDGIKRQNADFSDPDISYSDGLNTFSYPVHLSCDGGIPLGVYIVRYDVEAEGYDSGYLSHTFIFDVKTPAGKITPNFDVFTPSIKATDDTTYSASGWTDSEVRSFTGNIIDLGQQISVDTAIIDMKYGSQYYDSRYSFTLKTTVTYDNISNSWLSFKTIVTASIPATGVNLSANTPPTCQHMINQYTDYATQVNDSGCGCSNPDQQKLTQAAALLNSINASLSNQDYDGLYDTILGFEYIVTNGTYSYTNTGDPISAYVYNCGGSSSGGTGGYGLVTVSFTVGDSGWDISGDSSVTISALATGSTNAKSILIFTKGSGTELPNVNYTFTASTGLITLLGGDIFNQGEQIFMQAIYAN